MRPALPSCSTRAHQAIYPCIPAGRSIDSSPACVVPHSRPAPDDAPTTAASAFLGEPGGGHPLDPAAHHLLQVGGNTVFSDPRSEVTCNNNSNLHDGVCFAPRKRARPSDDVVGAAGLTMGGHRALLPVPVPVPVPVPQAFEPTEDLQRRVLCSVDASTSGRQPPCPTPASHGVLPHLHRHSVEMDAFIRIEVRQRFWLPSKNLPFPISDHAVSCVFDDRAIRSDDQA